MPHFFVVANIWCADELQKHEDHKDLSSWINPINVQKSFNDDEAVYTGTTNAALASSGCNGKHVTSLVSLYRLVVTYTERFH